MSERSRTVFSWQGWQLEIPLRWAPLKLEGDYDSGHALFADLHRPRLGLRWARPKGRKFDAPAWVQGALKGEIGTLAAAEARPFTPAGAAAAEQWTASTLYVEPEPPGRDVWVARSAASGRTVEMVYHSRRGEHLLAEALVPTLRDLPAERPMPWSVFELSCIVPPGFKLEERQLNAGDLSVTFSGPQGSRRQSVRVRQVAVAELALKRLPLDRWLLQQQRLRGRHYTPAGVSTDAAVQIPGGGPDAAPRRLQGIKRWSQRRWRFAWMWWLTPGFVTYALHDAQRDRLVLVDATDEQLLLEVARTIGWARSV